MAPIHETNWDLIVSNEDLAEVAVNRLKEFIEESVDNSLLEERLNNGWKLKNKIKEKAKYIKKKELEMPLKMRCGLFFIKWDLNT